MGLFKRGGICCCFFGGKGGEAEKCLEHPLQNGALEKSDL